MLWEIFFQVLNGLFNTDLFYSVVYMESEEINYSLFFFYLCDVESKLYNFFRPSGRIGARAMEKVAIFKCLLFRHFLFVRLFIGMIPSIFSINLVDTVTSFTYIL